MTCRIAGGTVGKGERPAHRWPEEPEQMDEEVLILAGIGNSKSSEGPENSPRVIIKPSWLRTEKPDDPTEAGLQGSSDATNKPEKTKSSAQKLKKRKISSTSTPRNLRQRPRGDRSATSQEDVEMTGSESGGDTGPDCHKTSKMGENEALLSSFKDYMGGQLAELKTGFRQDIKEAVTQIADQVKSNTNSIAQLRDEMNSRLTDNVAAAVSAEMKKYGVGGGVRAVGKGDESAYWRSRRSIRCWPITGPDRDLWGLTGDFLIKTLGVPSESIPQEEVETIRRISTPRNRRPGKIQNEVLVIFKSVSTRDLVYSYAPNLANYRQAASPPGVRIDFPDHLRGVFSTLEKYGATLRTELGSNFKRSIKFEDAQMSLRIDVCFPGDTEWTKISLDIAREEMDKRKQLETRATRERVGSISGPSTADSWDRGSSSSERTTAMVRALPNNVLPESATLVERAANREAQRWGPRI